MKNKFVLLLLLLSTVVFGQIRIDTHPLELKKSKDFHQILTTFDKKTDTVFVFASDKEKTTILKYSPFLFFKDSLTTSRPPTDYKFLLGYSFDTDESPTLYWASEDFKKIAAVHYNLNTKNTTTTYFQLPFVQETVLQVFNENNYFYLLTKKNNADVLVLYVFNNNKKEEHWLDFSSFEFLTRKNERISLSLLLTVLPLEKIETRSYNPLIKTARKSKFYVRQKDIVFTFDHNFKETQLFQVDLNNFEIKERRIQQLPLQRLNSVSNSYYHENKIYQLVANEEEMNFGFKDFETATIIKEFNVKKTDSIAFKNSPLLSQIENQPPIAIKNTARFLSQLSVSDIGITVYKTPKSLFMTIGGHREVEQFSPIFMSNGNLGDFMTNSYYLSAGVYFESLFDKSGNAIKGIPEPLAEDFIANFSKENSSFSLQNSFKYKSYFIHTYYDYKLKQLVMQKFYDGF